MPLQAAETEPLAVAASEPPAIDWSDTGGMSQPEPPDLFEVLQEQQPAPDPLGTGDGSDALDDYDPLFDDEFDLDFEEAGAGDPLEGFNRGVFAFNETLDSFAWEPITHGYQFVVPAPARRGVHRFFQNLESPVIMTNQILQLRMRDAGITLGRFLINTTAGAVGLFDPAADGVGLERVEGDFGQTLARYGTPSGAFLMVPLLGPSSVRDLCGDVIDRLMDPLTYMIGPIQWWIALGTSRGLAEREAYSDELEALEASSIDFYSALRSAYQQSRAAEIRHARGEDEDGLDDPVLSSY
jgi:phospholipid-binding lipoprotein MlaA